MTWHEPAVPIMAAILGGIALVLSIWVFKRTLDFQAYRELDSNYMEILKQGIEHPYLRDPKITNNYKDLKDDKGLKDTERILRYETYAFMVWNMCETVYDRKRVNETWLPVIKTEKDLHLAWLKEGENTPKFKPEFVAYVMKEPLQSRSGMFAR
jgi:hypothetical protein